MNPPYKGVICRGSIMLGSACGHCARCADERARMLDALAKPPLSGVPAPITGEPRGCVCPPTSEQTCMSQFCPRKAIPGYIIASGPAHNSGSGA